MSHHRRYAHRRTLSQVELRHVLYRRSIIAADNAPPEPLALKIGDRLYMNEPMLAKLREVVPRVEVGAVNPFAGVPIERMPKWMEGAYRRNPLMAAGGAGEGRGG